MGTWNINAATDLISIMAQSTYMTDTNDSRNLSVSNSAVNTSDYARILAEQIAEVNAQTNNMQNQSNNAQNNFGSPRGNKSGNGNSIPAIETLRRIMPDGSIKIVTYEDGKIVDSFKLRTHTVMTPDYSAPPNPDGNPQVKAEQKLSLAALLMV